MVAGIYLEAPGMRLTPIFLRLNLFPEISFTGSNSTKMNSGYAVPTYFCPIALALAGHFPPLLFMRD